MLRDHTGIPSAVVFCCWIGCCCAPPLRLLFNPGVIHPLCALPKSVCVPAMPACPFGAAKLAATISACCLVIHYCLLPGQYCLLPAQYCPPPACCRYRCLLPTLLTCCLVLAGWLAAGCLILLCYAMLLCCAMLACCCEPRTPRRCCRCRWCCHL